MRRKNHSRASLFLMELMISVLFFSLTAAVFMQVFVKSHTISQESEELFRAQAEVASVAEVLRGSRNFSEDIARCFSNYTVSEEGIVLHYDSGWQEAGTEQDDRLIEITWQEQDGLCNITIQASSEDEEDIYHLNFSQWMKGS